MEYRKLSHCVYHCSYHLVLVPKYRRKIFNAGTFAYFLDKLQEVRKHYPLLEFEVVNHDIDHVHLKLEIPPTMAVGDAVRIIKSNTARSMKQKFPFLKSLYWGTDGIWSDGYFVSSTGVDEEIIRKYIEHQGQMDSGQAKLALG